LKKLPPKVLTKKVQKAKPLPKPEIAKPKVPVEKTKPPVLNQKIPKSYAHPQAGICTAKTADCYANGDI